MAGGRPTEYTTRTPAEWKNAIGAYIDQCRDQEVQVGESAKGWPMLKLRVKLPSIEGLADYLDLSKDTIYEWGKLYAEFSDAIRMIKVKQADRLINNGLSGDYNPLIAKLLLASNHGMADKSEIDQKGEINHNLKIEFINGSNPIT